MPRLFASSSDEPRYRAGTDVLLLVVSVGGLVAGMLASVPPAGIERAIDRFSRSLPSSIGDLGRVLLVTLACWAASIVVAIVVRQRFALLRDLVASTVAATAVFAGVTRHVTGDWPATELGLSRDSGVWAPPILYVVVVTAAVAASPHVALPARRVGRWLVALAALGVVASGTPATGATAGLLSATAGAAVGHLLFGSARGRPSLVDIASGLAELGVQASIVGAATRQTAGVFEVNAVHEDGRPLVVKIHGRDAHDTALGRVRQAEREALATLLAAGAGVPVAEVIAVGKTARDDAVIVLAPHGPSLAAQPAPWATPIGPDDVHGEPEPPRRWS